MSKSKNHLVYQFKISLYEIEPLIWRRIQVPANYNFWDLHVAIQDAMGWLDYHLHAFRIRQKHKKKSIEIGIPVDDWDGDPVIPGWEIPIGDGVGPNAVNLRKIMVFTSSRRQKPGPEELEKTGFLPSQE